MTKLPQVSGRKAVKAFERAGWIVSRQRGSHVILTKPGNPLTLSVPQHNPMGRGLLHDLIRKADLTVDEFLDLL